MKNKSFIFAIFIWLIAPLQALPLAENQTQQIDSAPGSRLEDWLISEVVNIPTNITEVEQNQVDKYEARKVAASLVERKRRFDQRWAPSNNIDNNSESDSDSENGESPTQSPTQPSTQPSTQAQSSTQNSAQNKSTTGYELVSFFPEEFIDSLVKNGQLTGHELPQKKERQTDIDSYIHHDLQIVDEKDRLRRLIEDGRFMQTRGQCQATVDIYEKALELAKKIDPSRVQDLQQRIAFFKERELDPGMAAAREYGWERRAELEYLHLGLRVGSVYSGGTRNFANSLLPKYGIINFTSKAPLTVNRRELLHYGALIIVYRDELRFRASYSFGDSTIVTRGQNGLAQSREVKSLMDFNPQHPPVKSILFVEAQVWGPIDMTDIKEFRIPKDREDLVATLSKSGLPVYTYDRDGLAADPAYVPAAQLGIDRVTLIYPGDPKLQDKYQLQRQQRFGLK